MTTCPRLVVWCCAAVAALAGTAACGSGSPGPTPSTPVAPPAMPAASSSGPSSSVDPAFRAEVDHECALGTAYAQAHPFPYPDFDPTHPAVDELPVVAAYFRRAPDVAHKLITLAPPASGRANWRELVAALSVYDASLHRQIAAASASDAAAFVAAVRNLPALQQRLQASAISAGLITATSCATYFGS